MHSRGSRGRHRAGRGRRAVTGVRWRLRSLKLAGDEQFGVTIVRRACEEPVRQIVRNCGTEGAVVVEKINASQDVNFGFNASTEQYEDLVKAGVIDPAKVTRTALEMQPPSPRSC